MVSWKMLFIIFCPAVILLKAEFQVLQRDMHVCRQAGLRMY